MLVPLLFSLGVRERETLSHYIFKKKKVWPIYLESDPIPCWGSQGAMVWEQTPPRMCREDKVWESAHQVGPFSPGHWPQRWDPTL